MSIEERLRELGERQRRDPSPSREEWNAFRDRGHRRLARRRAGLALAASAAAVIAVIGVQNAGSLIDQNAAPLPPAGGEGSRGERRTGGTARGAFAVQTWWVKDDLLYLTHQLVDASLHDGMEPLPQNRVDVMAEALERLLAGPPSRVTQRDGSGLRSALPPGARLLGFELGPRAEVDLAGLSAGLSANERRIALAQVAATVLQDDEVDSVEVLEQGVPLTEAPLTEDSFESLLSPIVVTEPPFAERPRAFAGEVLMEGTADVFEATVSYELIDLKGKAIAEGFTTATCGSGCRGTFSDRVGFDVAARTMALLNVYSPSAEDGSRMFEVSVPVLLCPAQAASDDDLPPNAYGTCEAG